jgi:anti-sigma regulatory factor (Ser/Thr protein kinase)
MTELSLHILDIVQNSIVAGATLIEIKITEDLRTDKLIIEISDNGKGMDENATKRAVDPYATSRTTRKVGLGLPLFKLAAEQCNGMLQIESKPGVGTKVTTTMQLNHIDRQPMGDISGVITLLVSANPAIDFVYEHITNKGEYVFETKAIKKELDDVPITNREVIKFICEMIQENLKEINILS